MSLASRIRAFAINAAGTSAVEFGFIAIPFLGLMLAIFEAGFVFFNSETLETAVQDAARAIMTGQAQSSGVSTSAQFVSTYLCPAQGRQLPSYIDCSQLIVDVRSASSFANADVSSNFYKSPSSQEFCPGGAGTIMVVRVAYPMPVYLPTLGLTSLGAFHQVMTGIVNDVPGNPGFKHLLVGTAVFQTEPFSSSSYTPPPGC